MKHVLIVNGLDGPMLKQFGCDCGRCTAPGRQANTSASLLSLSAAGEVAHHVLFDIGLGVVDSLRENPYLRGDRARLDWIVLTHWHPDHVLELNRLTVSYNLRRRRDWRVPLWCRSGTAAWLEKEHSYEWGDRVQAVVSGEKARPGTILPPLPIDLPGLTITPVTISHYGADISPDRQQTCYSCAAYVIQSADKKIVLLWDLDSTNEWLVAPDSPAGQAAVQLLTNADHLFIDTAFWNVERQPTSHPGFRNVRRFARALRPRETLLVHLSGHPDRPGNPGYGWTNEQWQTAAHRVWEMEGLPGRVRVPHIGEEYHL